MIAFHSGLDGVTFRSKGSKLLGGLYRAECVGPRPTALLLHGLPGVGKNLDIAYSLREDGWNCLFFHYRGSWGTEGAYTLEGQIDDLPAVESVAEQLLKRSVLILTGNKDGIFSPDHYPPLMHAVSTIEWHEFPDGDHSLSLWRQEIVRRSVNWLATHMG
jgi:pimeloyl-ACP methyl ester carboxylesterase